MAKKKSLVSLIIAYEGGELSAEDTLRLFAKLIKSGLAWQLQGHYGRTAASLIEHLSPHHSPNKIIMQSRRIISWRMRIPVKGVSDMKTIKAKKFAEWLKERADKVLSFSVTYYGESLMWRPECGAIIWDRGVGVGEFYPDWTLDDALAKVEGGKARVIFSDLGEVVLRLRP